jgi:hypothetical protein
MARMKTMSTGPEPTTWYAIATSPLRAYDTSGGFTTRVWQDGEAPGGTRTRSANDHDRRRRGACGETLSRLIGRSATKIPQWSVPGHSHHLALKEGEPDLSMGTRATFAV